jgi:hypothetical protein
LRKTLDLTTQKRYFIDSGEGLSEGTKKLAKSSGKASQLYMQQTFYFSGAKNAAEYKVVGRKDNRDGTSVIWYKTYSEWLVNNGVFGAPSMTGDTDIYT